jgi:hypothetical protein
VGDDDVLCGRGGGTNTHIGNVRFRAVVADHQGGYLVARRPDKEKIARDIVKIIQQRGGRFLRKDESVGTWQQVDEKKATAKAGQALREGLDIRNRVLKSSPSAVSSGSPVAAAAPAAAALVASSPTLDQLVALSTALPFDSTPPPKNSPPQKEITVTNEKNYQQEDSEDDATEGKFAKEGVTSNDVLCGRGGHTNSHEGNIRFRTLVSSHQPKYLTAKKREKEGIARDIVEIIQRRGGRFLQKGESGTWEQVDYKKAVLKASQALREGLDMHKRTFKSIPLMSPVSAAICEPSSPPPPGAKKAPVSTFAQSPFSGEPDAKRRKLNDVISQLHVLGRKELETVARLALELRVLGRKELEIVARIALEATTDDAVDAATAIIHASAEASV